MKRCRAHSTGTTRSSHSTSCSTTARGTTCPQDHQSPSSNASQRCAWGIEFELAKWEERAELARLVDSNWQKLATTALRTGNEPPPKPSDADPGPRPHMPCLAIADVTMERIGVIASMQPRGILLARDELAGWLQSMARYSGGGSDRPFWLEAYGGRSYRVERRGRDPVYVHAQFWRKLAFQVVRYRKDKPVRNRTCSRCAVQRSAIH